MKQRTKKYFIKRPKRKKDKSKHCKCCNNVLAGNWIQIGVCNECYEAFATLWKEEIA